MTQTDLYTISMSYAFWKAGRHNDVVTYEGFVRHLPAQRNFLVMAGLESLIYRLQAWRIDEMKLLYLKELEQFKDVPNDFWNYLYNLRFNADVRALPEGTVFFQNTPFIQISGPLVVCQLVETLVLSVLNYSIAVASKAARIRLAAGNDIKLSEFGFRRAPGPEAALLATKASFIGGFDNTSNVEAGYEYGIPCGGTIAHSYIMLHETEKKAFESYKEAYGNNVSVLIDTYNVKQGVKNAVDVFGKELKAVRLDSGDKLTLSRQIRQDLDEMGNTETKIVVSDDMNEHKIQILRKFKAPIDAFGVGTELVNPGALGGVYKLVEANGVLPSKRSEGKITVAGKKEIFRYFTENQTKYEMKMDVIRLKNEPCNDMTATLLRQFLSEGEIYGNYLYNAAPETRLKAILKSLPDKYKEIDNVYVYDVEYSDTIKKGLSNDFR